MENEKIEYHHLILGIRTSLVQNFTLNKKFLKFGTKFAQNRYIRLKTKKKMNITIEFRIFGLT